MALAPDDLYSSRIKFHVGVDPVPKPLKGTVDLIVCTGAMLPSHLPPTVFHIALQILKPDGFLVFSVRDSIYCPDSDIPFKDIMNMLEQEGKYQFIHRHKFVNGIMPAFGCGIH
mmetsp:Transcript_33460/g.24549  ORF Transcript_33460/g.24549 Transcript_33460/m.24549 type:complete len:114 (+) Transcript_33460:274-615(+)